ncbi:hypothetical protein GUJ93_ZPchr0003g18309 [Zizania palustris]|uniref:SHSP domain-containing protein n=1 Tax=Zizania palustris TaxID=103762 RepID=A0A8J5VJB6_ZIZPA|nr:hypothetical protein GUJ93_ZPchr0003g18309 [Zizania palustris]
MQAAAAAAAPPPAAPRHRASTAVDTRCEWTRTEDADTLVVDVSGFRKEELKVLYNTSRKLKVTGERQADGGQRARFLKMFPVPRSCDTDGIRAVMDKEEALLYVILPKGSSSSSSSKDRNKDEQDRSSQPQGGAAMADGSPSGTTTSSDSLYSAQEDAQMGKIDEKRNRDLEIAAQDVPTRTHGDVSEVKRDDDTRESASKRWLKRMRRPLHVLGIVLILAVAAAGAYVLYIMLL